MAHIPKPLPNPLHLLLLASATLSAISASRAGPMFIQDTSCSASGLQTCPLGLPNNFCCPAGTSCMALAGNTTALCCPQGQTCAKIQPITCDVRQQDPDQNENVPIKTSIFNVELEKCGSNLCCPFGYSCLGGNQCLKDQDQSKSPRAESPTFTTSSTSAKPPAATATTTSAATQESTASATSSATAASSTTAEASKSHASNPKTVSIVGGVIGGCAILVLIGVIAFLFVRRNRHRSSGNNPEKADFARINNNNNNSGPGRYGNIISDPIIQPNSYRTDFILKSPSASSSISQRPPQFTYTYNPHPPRLSIPNPFNSPSPSALSRTPSLGSVCSSDDSNARTGHVGAARLAPIRAMKASSTRIFPQDVQHNPSCEDINVFADSNAVDARDERRQTHATTFTDLMYEADLGEVRRGQPYVPGSTLNI